MSFAAEHQRGTRGFLRGNLDLDVRGAGLGQTLTHDAMRELGPVAVAAQVTEVEVPEFSRDNLHGNFSSGFI
jgi:hypothetical protein